MNDSDIENNENEIYEEEMETNKNYQQCMIY